MHSEIHGFLPRGRKPKSDSEIGPKQLKRRAKKIVDRFNEATKDNDVFKTILMNFQTISFQLTLNLLILCVE